MVFGHKTSHNKYSLKYTHRTIFTSKGLGAGSGRFNLNDLLS